MNEQIKAQALPLLRALAKLNDLGIKVISVHLDHTQYFANVHVTGEFDPSIFNSAISTDCEGYGEYIKHDCLFDGVVVFWLEKKEEVEA